MFCLPRANGRIGEAALSVRRWILLWYFYVNGKDGQIGSHNGLSFHFYLVS
ncbi:hypothetical protein HNR34_002934 [Geobacillus subterraneus]